MSRQWCDYSNTKWLTIENADSALFKLEQTFKDHIEWSSVESVMFLQQRPELYSWLSMTNFTKTEKLNFQFYRQSWSKYVETNCYLRQFWLMSSY